MLGESPYYLREPAFPALVNTDLEQFRYPGVCVLDLEDAGDVAAPVAVVGGGPDRDQRVVKHVPGVATVLLWADCRHMWGRLVTREGEGS